MAFDQSLYPERRQRKPWTEHALNIGGLALAIAVIVALSPYVWSALFVWQQPMPIPQEQPTAFIAATARPRTLTQPAYSAPIPTLAPGIATEEESLLIYQATAAAMEQQALPVIPEGEEHGNKPSVKVWPTPEAMILEVQSQPAAPPTPSIFGSKPSQKRHP